MPRYEVRTFRDSLETHEDETVVVGSLTSNANGEHLVLVEIPSEGIEYECGEPTDSGTCSRTVDEYDATCFQH